MRIDLILSSKDHTEVLVKSKPITENREGLGMDGRIVYIVLILHIWDMTKPMMRDRLLKLLIIISTKELESQSCPKVWWRSLILGRYDVCFEFE